MTTAHEECSPDRGDDCPDLGFATSGLEDRRGSTSEDFTECRLCGEQATDLVPFDLCARCALLVTRYVNQMTDRADDRSLEERHVDWVAYQQQQAERRAASCVYYVRRGDRIKIGTTINLILRMRELRPDELLAVEPGGRALEQRRHREFAAMRVTPRGEWFHDTHVLRAHIADTIAEHGPPPNAPVF